MGNGETKTARQQRLRMLRFRIALLTYLLWIGVAFYCDYLGILSDTIGPARVSHWYLVVGIVASNTVFWWLFRSGRNLDYADPSLTLAQALVGITWALLFSALLVEARGLAVVIFIMTFLFGVFSLNRRQYLLLWCYAVAGYALLSWVVFPDLAIPVQQKEFMYLFVLTLSLFWIAFFGSYVGHLREQLSLRNSELKKALDMVEELAVKDDLTGAHNRRFMMDALEREIRRAERSGHPFALMMLDLDRFKKVNDDYGHSTGDAVLKEFVARVRDQVRSMDLVAKDTREFGRFGGEEFLVLLTDTNLEGARVTAERIRQCVERLPFNTPDGAIPVTVSIGVAEYRPGESSRSLLDRADKALYEAKDSGRNCVVAH